ncbi:MAG: glutamate--cysteine ligase [Pseudoclavibacter sp.]
MRIDFAQSRPSTLGVEWEVVLIDRGTRQPASRAAEIHDALQGTPVAERLDQELLENTVEIVTGVHDTVPSALGEIEQVSTSLSETADELGLGILCAGVHPFAKATQQPYTSNERYQKLIDRTQWWGRMMAIYGVHVHVGVDDRHKAVPLVNGLLGYLPHLQALSASSPWWEGINTGYASNRAMMFRQLPTAGLPPHVKTWQDFEAFVAGALQTGVIDQLNEIRWDIRPAPKFGTVENRVCDGLPTLFEVGALTAFIQCAVDELSEQIGAGVALDRIPDWAIAENKWRAARYGLPAVFIADHDLNERSVIDDTLELLDRWQPRAQRLGCAEQLADVESLIRGGASYQRQLRVASRHGDDLNAVVDALMAEFEAGRPLDR